MSISDYWDSTPRDLFNFIQAGRERMEFEIEQGYDNTRRIMWAVYQSMNGGHTKPQDFIRLSRDQPVKVLDPFEKQELEEWSRQCDAEMGLI